MTRMQHKGMGSRVLVAVGASVAIIALAAAPTFAAGVKPHLTALDRAALVVHMRILEANAGEPNPADEAWIQDEIDTEQAELDGVDETGQVGQNDQVDQNQTGDQQTGDEQTGEQGETGDNQADNNQADDQQSGDNQSGDNQSGDNQGDNGGSDGGD